MVPYMKASGTKTKLREKALFGMPKVTFTLVILELIRLMDLVFTLMLTEVGTKGNGLMMFKKDREKRYG